MLDAMFSGRHELCRDAEGSVFIDRDFKYFRFVRGKANLTFQMGLDVPTHTQNATAERQN